jgi:hypothetical protein
MQTDRYGLPLSTSQPRARDAYLAAVDSLLGAMPGDLEGFEAALRHDPDFALAAIGLARALLVRMRVSEARHYAASARALVAGASERERSHVHVLALGIEGKTVEALDAMHAHLRRWPRDAMVLAPATGVFGIIGFSGRSEREREQFELLQALAPHYREGNGGEGNGGEGDGEDWWFGMALAFAACETGRLDLAAPMIERSLARMPTSGNVVHVHAHVAYELGDTQSELSRLEASLRSYPREALMHCHLSWHAALFAMQLGDADKAWRHYRDSVHPDVALAPPLNMVTDCASFLWRAELADQPAPGGAAGAQREWDTVRRSARQYFPKAGVTFADVHVALACIASGDRTGLGELRAQLAERLAAGKLTAGPAVLSLVDGLAAYRDADWPRAVRELGAALPETVRIGGSRAQRDLVALTLAEAQRQAGVGTGRAPGFR